MRLALALLLCLTIHAAVSEAAGVRPITIGTQPSELQLLVQDSDALIYRATIGELATMDVTTPEGTFSRLMIPGFHASRREGAPELPMMNRLIEIPYGATASAELISVKTREIDLASLGIVHPLLPAQPSMPKSADPATWPFVYDEASYTGRVANEMLHLAPQGRLRAVEIGRLEVSPIEYYPEEGRIVVCEEIEFRVRFDGADHAAGAMLDAATRSPFFDPIYEQIEGYRGIHDQHPDRVRDIVTMVVVTPPEFEAQMQGFVEWKTRRGFHVIVGVTGTPPVGTTKESIRDWLWGLYNNGTPELPSPSFVLFVGDVAQMPTWTLSGDATDRPYCAVDADLMPDMYYGRFSATNPSQLQAQLDKTLMYDQFTMPDPSYLGEVVMIAGMDSGHGQVWANGQINYGTTNYFNESHGILSHTYLYPGSGGADAQIVADVSEGVGYINYTAHGSETSWSDPTFTQGNVNSLQNAGKYCLAVGNCCLTSSYDVSECFAETWLRAANKGAIGYIGGSNSTYWDEDYYWGVGYRASIVEHPVFDPNHMGAYDGLFHDHGEAMTQWYVTNDALIFCGNLAVTESGSSLTTYYWNIYNLMGDPSLSTYLGVPTENPVTHPATIFTTWDSFEVTAVPNSYVGFTKNGVLIGAGTVPESGVLDLPIWEEPFLPGTAHLVVMAQNRIPYETDLNVIIPATVYIDPDAIDANVETAVSVGVFEYDGVTPIEGVEIWADGLDYESGHAFTAADGYCTITVNYPYGPSIDIVGKRPGDSYELFREPLRVNALNLTLPSLSVTTDIGLNDAFALNLPGTIHANVGQSGYTLWAILNGEPIGSVVGNALTVTPAELGTVRGIIALSGYDIYWEDFPVIEAYGTLSGHIDANGSPAVGAVLTGYDVNMEIAFEATANAQGDYAIADEIVVAPYTIRVAHFGSLPYELGYFLNYGANVLDIVLDPAPSGVIAGTVLEEETDLPLEADIKIYRLDTLELYAQTTSSAIDGSYTTPALPYFDYRVVVKAWHHIPVTVNVTVDQPVITRDFWLEATIGDILVVNDGAKAGTVEPKLDEKTGAIIEPGYTAADDKSVTDVVTDLETLGYTVTVEQAASTDPASWENYDLLMSVSGSNTSTLTNSAYKLALVAFVERGGHLLIEGGEVGYDHYGDTNFASKVLHSTDWNADNSGNLTVAAPSHYVMSVPNQITGPVTMSYVGYGDEDAMAPLADAVKVGSWTSYPNDASVICYDTNPAPQGGQIVYFAFNYSAMNASVRPLLLQNAVTWLMTPEFGDCSVAGRVTLAGQGDHSGVRVEAIPNGGHVLTNAAGEYCLEGLFSGTYTIRATKEDWSTGNVEVTLTEGQQLTGVDFVLTPVFTHEQCREPHLTIPDNNTTGVTDVMGVLIGGGVTISAVEVYVNITHTYIGDLMVQLTSPDNATVVLHNRSGGSADNIVGWYPTQLTPSQSLDAFIGGNPDGLWRLKVSDLAGGDSGVLNQWCLRIYYGGSTADAEDGAKPTALFLASGSPNPMGLQTAVRFDLPARSRVDLAVYDIGGRRVASLVDGLVDAGRHQIAWKGISSEGETLASGVYLCRLTTEMGTLTRKLHIVR